MYDSTQSRRYTWLTGEEALTRIDEMLADRRQREIVKSLFALLERVALGRARRSEAHSLVFQWVPRGWVNRVLACYRNGDLAWDLKQMRSLALQGRLNQDRVSAFVGMLLALDPKPMPVDEFRLPQAILRHEPDSSRLFAAVELLFATGDVPGARVGME